MSIQTGPRPSDRFIPWYIVLFFVVQTGFFAWFYHIAASTFTGMVTDRAYEKGLQYNQVIAKYNAQEKLGWTSEITRKGNGIQLILKDARGNLLSGAKVRLWLVRPVHDGVDQHLEMQEMATGDYFSPLALPEKGIWEARIEAESQGHTYQSAKRMEF